MVERDLLSKDDFDTGHLLRATKPTPVLRAEAAAAMLCRGGRPNREAVARHGSRKVTASA